MIRAADVKRTVMLVSTLQSRYMNKLKSPHLTEKELHRGSPAGWLAMRICVLVGIVCLYLMGNGVVRAEIQAPAYQIKAAYLYNFILFTVWPEPENNNSPSPNNTITIGIIGKDPFGKSFAQKEGKPIKSMKKKLVIKRFGPYRSGTDFKKCQILFISSSEKNNFKKILSEVKGTPVLTVADVKGFLDAGGMINLVTVGEKIRWEINQTSVKTSELQLSSQLFRSAARVVENP